MEKADYLIRGGRVIDCYCGQDTVRDIAVKNGRIVSAEHVEAAQEIDASGCIVTPGLIDFHCHLGAYVTDLGILGEAACFPSGVTTAVDAGSTGTANYESFRMLTANSRLRVKAFLNVCPAGLVTGAYHENINPAYFQRETILRFLKKYSDQLLGLKIRQSKEIADGLGLEPMKAMLEIAGEAGCPVVVHTTNPPRPPEEIARLLRPGDVYAHVYQGKGGHVVRDGAVIPELPEHQKRGVIFDAANGANHFCLKVARICLEQGFRPDIISTDLTAKTVFVPGKVFSLTSIMSKYVALGMEIPEIIRRTTVNPARILGEERELGSLCEGTCADIAVHRLAGHPVSWTDFLGDELKGDFVLKTEMTMREGRTVFRQIDF